MKTLVLAALCGLASAASANVFESVAVPGRAADPFGVAGLSSNNNDRVLGDTVNVAVTGFSTAGGAFLAGPGTHTVGGNSVLNGLAGLTASFNISSSVSDAGGIRTLSISMTTIGGGAIGIPGLAVGGAPISSLFFELPDLNGGPDLFDDAQKVGAAAGTFNLLGTGGATLFSAAAGIVDSGTSFSIGNGISAGGANLFDPAAVGDILTGASWTVSYAIPAPGAAAMLALAGLGAARRRR